MWLCSRDHIPVAGVFGGEELWLSVSQGIDLALRENLRAGSLAKGVSPGEYWLVSEYLTDWKRVMIGAEFLPSCSLDGDVYFMGVMGRGYF